MMIERKHGWRFYDLRLASEARIGINQDGRAKWFPAACPINSTWIDRNAAARALRLERLAERLRKPTA